MIFYNVKTEEIVDVEGLKKAVYPMTLAVNITDDSLSGTDFVILNKEERPTPSILQKVVEDTVTNIDGKYYLSYKLVDRYEGTNKATIEAEVLAEQAKNRRKNKH